VMHIELTCAFVHLIDATKHFDGVVAPTIAFARRGDGLHASWNDSLILWPDPGGGSWEDEVVLV
jgi:hypothetical protein